MNGVRVRPARPADRAARAELFARAFRRPTSSEHQRWKLDSLPSPVANVWLAVDEEDRPLCQYAGIPGRLILPGRELEVMVAVDGMTDPAHRRRGLLTAVVTAAHRAYREAGIAAVLGLPNEQWGSRTAALDWRPLFPLAWRWRPLRPELLLARRLGWPALGRLRFLGRGWDRLAGRRPAPDVTVDDVAAGEPALAPAADAVEARCRRQPLFALAGGGERFVWRYAACPTHPYRMLLARRDGEPAGLLAYRLTGGEPARSEAATVHALIAELRAAAGDAGVHDALLAAFLGRARAAGAVAAGALAAVGSPLDRHLRRHRFLRRRRAFTVHLVPLAPGLPLARLADPRRWALQGGDFDVV